MQVMLPKSFVCRDYVRASITTAAVVHLGTTYAAEMKKNGKNCCAVAIKCETYSIRERHDGGDPSTGAAGNGSPYAPNVGWVLTGPANVNNLRLIGLDGTAIVHINFYYEN